MEAVPGVRAPLAHQAARTWLCHTTVARRARPHVRPRVSAVLRLRDHRRSCHSRRPMCPFLPRFHPPCRRPGRVGWTATRLRPVQVLRMNSTGHRHRPCTARRHRLWFLHHPMEAWAFRAAMGGRRRQPRLHRLSLWRTVLVMLPTVWLPRMQVVLLVVLVVVPQRVWVETTPSLGCWARRLGQSPLTPP